MSEPTPEQLKRQIIRFVLARNDMRCAAELAETLLNRPMPDGSLWSWGVLTGMVVSYARPFTESAAYGQLGDKWTKFPDRQELERHHKSLLAYRHKLLAHNDLSDHREVLVIPSGGVLNVPFPTEARSTIDPGGIRNAKELFEAQEDRLGAEAVKLIERLQTIEQWPTEGEIHLKIDDV